MYVYVYVCSDNVRYECVCLIKHKTDKSSGAEHILVFDHILVSSKPNT